MVKKQEIAVAIKNIHKEFILPQSKNSTFKQTVVNIVKNKNKVTQKVLNGVSFNINKGDFFGIVGRNGSGKSTLLKLIAGVYTPTAGEITLNGGLTPFIELGVGFNPELSGRDNVYLNGALLGFNRKQMDEMYDEIVDFAELWPFMGQKLKNYSSGMQVRLAFSIAIKAKNEILMFDEVLAVGDEAFQQKCLDIFEKYKAEGQTIILVTHDMGIVRRFCNKAVLISGGEIVEIGDPRLIAEDYSKLNQDAINQSVEKNNTIKSNNCPIKIQTLDHLSRKVQSYKFGDKMTVEIKWNGLDEKDIESLGINIFKRSGEHLTGINTRTGNLTDGWKKQRHLKIEFDLSIKPGKYYLLVEIFNHSGIVVGSVIDGPEFSVENIEMQWSGLIELPHRWEE